MLDGDPGSGHALISRRRRAGHLAAVPDARAHPAFAKTEVLAFDALSLRQLYDLLRLRSAVFVVEQDCVYEDADGLDEGALHVLTTDARGLVGYTRLLAPGTSHAEASAIGRVVTAPEARGEGLGRAVVTRSIGECRRRWPQSDILIHAQSYLLDFYAALGFVAEGEEFLEDGLPHFRMRLRPA